jgi:hypothetical protein
MAEKGLSKNAKPSIAELEERVKVAELRAREVEALLRVHEAQTKLKSLRGKA